MKHKKYDSESSTKQGLKTTATENINYVAFDGRKFFVFFIRRKRNSWESFDSPQGGSLLDQKLDLSSLESGFRWKGPSSHDRKKNFFSPNNVKTSHLSIFRYKWIKPRFVFDKQGKKAILCIEFWLGIFLFKIKSIWIKIVEKGCGNSALRHCNIFRRLWIDFRARSQISEQCRNHTIY